MFTRSRSRRIPLLFASVAVIALPLFGVFWVNEAEALTETIANGQITVTVDPVDNLTDGQAIDITVVANDGVNLNEVRANQCVAPVDNNFSHSKIGGFCAATPMSANSEDGGLGLSDPEKISGPFAPGTVNTTFTYKVGVGEQVATDILTGESRTIRCGPGLTGACFLDLWIQESLSEEVHYAVPLVFGEAAPPTTTTTTSVGETTTTAPGATTSTTAGGTTTTTADGTTTTTVAGATSTTVGGGGFGSTTTVAGGAASGGGSGSGSSGTGSGSGSGSSSLPVTGTSLGLAGLGAVLVGTGAIALLWQRRVRR